MMNDVINLIVVTKTPDTDGFEEETLTSMQCFAEIRSVRGTEFYQAAHEGIIVKIIAVVNIDDYDAAAVVDTITGKKRKPTHVEYDSQKYRIVRDYKTSKTKIELTLQEVE